MGFIMGSWDLASLSDKDGKRGRSIGYSVHFSASQDFLEVGDGIFSPLACFLTSHTICALVFLVFVLYILSSRTIGYHARMAHLTS